MSATISPIISRTAPTGRSSPTTSSTSPTSSSLTIGLRYTHENKDFSANFNNTNTVCPTQQAFFSNFLPGGATPLPATLQPLAQGIVNLTCQGNSSSALNALTLADERDESEWTGTGVLSFKPNDEPAALRQLFARL